MIKSLSFQHFVEHLKRYAEEKILLKIYSKPHCPSTFCYIGYIESVTETAIILKGVEFDYIRDEVKEWKLTDWRIPIQHILIGALEDAEKEVIGQWIEKESSVKLS